MTEHTIDLTDEQARSAAEGTLTEIRVEIEGLPQARGGEFKMIRRQMEWHVEWQLFAGTDFIQSVVPIFEIGDTINCREYRFTVQSVGAEQEGEKWYWVLGVEENMKNRNGEVICPECMNETDQDELDCFGGLCEECSGAFDDEK